MAPMARKLALSFFAALVLYPLAGCVLYSDTSFERGAPVDPRALAQISIGRTTQSEVFRLLGTPHSMFEGQVRFQEVRAMGVMDSFFLHKDDRYLTSLDEKHTAMLYRFAQDTGTSVRASAVIVTYQGTNITLKTDELLLLINKDSRVVDDIAYRRETQRR